MRPRRRITALVIAGAAVLLCSATALADLTPSPPPVGAAPEFPILVTLAAVRPLAPQPGDTLTVSGVLRNLADAPVSGLTVQLAVSRTKIGSRGEFDAYAADPTGEPPLDAIVLPDEQIVLPRTTLPAGSQESFSVSLPVDELSLPQVWQVYEMAVVVNADTALGHVPVGRLRTFLPYAPVDQPGTGEPTRVAWVWPMVDRPHRSDGGAWLDDDLAASLAPGGRLDRLLAAADTAQKQHPVAVARPRHTRHGKKQPAAKPPKPQPVVQPVPVTWVLDPALVDDVSAMRRGYTVQTSAGSKPGAGKSAANRWLGQLKQDIASTEYFGVPYADPDVTAAAHAGLGQDVQIASTRGNTLLHNDVGGNPLPYAWPPDGYADQRTLDTFFGAGETTVVLDSAALPIVGVQPNQTPGAHARVIAQATESFDALLADDQLNQAVDAGALPGANGPLAVQRVLSELLMIQAEGPFNQRSLVITPDRRWDPTATYATALLTDSGKVPWVDPIPLSAVTSTPVDDEIKRPTLDYPAAEHALQLSRAYLSDVAHVKHLVDTFTDVVAPATAQPTADPLVGSFNDGVLRLLSSAWRGDPATGGDFTNNLLSSVTRTMNRVRIASRASSLVTLTSHSGTVPVTVANDLDVPVSVVVKVQPDQHLVVRGEHVVQVIPAHRQLPVDIHATAQTSGVFGLTVQLTTPSGKPYGAAVPLRIRSTAYGKAALLITGGATAVLLLTVVIRLFRRARAARRSAPAAV